MTTPTPDPCIPASLHLKKTEALDISWPDGQSATLPLRYLRKHCPCAGCQGERDLLGRTLLPVLRTIHDGPITALAAQLVGNYALRIDWSDHHSSGIYSFRYLRQLADELATPSRRVHIASPNPAANNTAPNT